jgi:hypothetical protein
MTHSEIERHVLPNVFSHVQCLVFQKGDKYMIAAENAQQAFFLYAYAISFDILVSRPQFFVFLIFFTYQHLLHPSVRLILFNNMVHGLAIVM